MLVLPDGVQSMTYVSIYFCIISTGHIPERSFFFYSVSRTRSYESGVGVVLWCIRNFRCSRTFRAKVCQPTAGPISTYSQTEVDDHADSFWIERDQHVKPLRPFLAF